MTLQNPRKKWLIGTIVRCCFSLSTQSALFVRRAIEQEKTVYRESFESIRVLKPEIEYLRKVVNLLYIYIYIFWWASHSLEL